MKKASLKMFGFAFALGACIFSGASSFASEPCVYWNKQVIYAVDTSKQTPAAGSCLKNVDYRSKLLPAVAEVIQQKLDHLSKKGALPFDIKYFVDPTNFNAKDIAGSEGKVQLMIPVVLGDTYHRDSAVYKGQIYHKYDVKTLISLMFCEIGEDVDGHTGVHVIYTVPMMAYATPGSQFEVTAPLDEKILAKQFFFNSKEAVVQDLDFAPDFGKYLGDKHTGNLKNIYRVTDVKLCNLEDRGKIRENNSLELKKSLADAYTSKFAKANRKYIVMPSTVSGQVWQRTLADYIRSFGGCSDVKVDFAEKANNNIVVNVDPWKVEKVDRGKYYDGHYDTYKLTIGINATISNGNGSSKQLKAKPYIDEYKIGQNTPISMTLNWNELFALAANKAIKGK